MDKGDYVVTPREEYFKMVDELVNLRRFYNEYYKNFSLDMTNGDNIRASNDEELAELLAIGCNGRDCLDPDSPRVIDKVDPACKQCWLAWLKERCVGQG